MIAMATAAVEAEVEAAISITEIKDKMAASSKAATSPPGPSTMARHNTYSASSIEVLASNHVDSTSRVTMEPY